MVELSMMYISLLLILVHEVVAVNSTSHLVFQWPQIMQSSMFGTLANMGCRSGLKGHKVLLKGKGARKEVSESVQSCNDHHDSAYDIVAC